MLSVRRVASSIEKDNNDTPNSLQLNAISSTLSIPI